jgi:hypothetical protein
MRTKLLSRLERLESLSPKCAPVRDAGRASACVFRKHQARKVKLFCRTSALMIGQMIRAFGPDDVALPGSSPENYVFR